MSFYSFNLKNLQNDGHFSGYASVFSVIDMQGDKVLPGAFHYTLNQWKQKKSWPKMLWQHNPSQPIGIWHSLKEDQHGLYAKGQLLLDVQQAKEAYSLLKANAVNHLSIGFSVIDADYDRAQGCRLLKKITLHEISLVTFAANNEARIYKKNYEILSDLRNLISILKS
jgi:hypothetical protein